MSIVALITSQVPDADVFGGEPGIAKIKLFASTIEEGEIGDILSKSLVNKGHVIKRKSMTSGIHIIYKDDMENLHGIADQRREGTAFGL